MKITDIKPTDNVKISRNSWTVKGDNLKTKGVIRNITKIMQLPARKLFDLHTQLKKHEIVEYRGNIYINADGELFYPHHVSNFYEKIKENVGEEKFNELWGESESYKNYLAYEAEVDNLRNCPILTVIDCYILT